MALLASIPVCAGNKDNILAISRLLHSGRLSTWLVKIMLELRDKVDDSTAERKKWKRDCGVESLACMETKRFHNEPHSNNGSNVFPSCSA